MIELSLIIPAFNEAKRIAPTLITYSQYLDKTAYNYEIIVANDGSNDNTVEVVKKLQNSIPQIKILNCEQNKGKGQAVRLGMLVATGEIRLFADADGATPIEELEKLIAPIRSNQVKITIGSRYLDKSHIEKSQPLYRRVWSRTANYFVQRLLLPGIVDPNCGFKAFDGQTAQFLFSQCIINEWSFDLEVLGLAKKHQLSILQVPVKWIHDEASKGKLRHLPKELKNLYKIRKRLAV